MVKLYEAKRYFNGTSWVTRDGVIYKYNDTKAPVLSDDGIDRLSCWEHLADQAGGCSCHVSPPCSVCTDENHPVSIDEDKSLWVQYVEPVLAAGYGDW